MGKSWKFAVATVLSAGAALGGIATPVRSAPPTGGVTVEQLTTPQPPKSGGWLPKLELPKFARPTRKAAPQPLDARDFDPAIASAKGEKKGDPVALARLCEKRGQIESAVKLYEQELAANPRNGLVHHRLAVITAKEDQWEKSRRHFEAARQLLPDNAEVLSDLGYALYLQHQLPEAERCLRAAVAASPKNQAARNNLGIVLGVQGKFDESLDEFRRVGSDAEAYANLGYVHAQLGDVELAMSNLQRALSLNPNLRPAAIALVQLNDLKGRFKDRAAEELLAQNLKKAATEKRADEDRKSAGLNALADSVPSPVTTPTGGNSRQRVFQEQVAASERYEPQVANVGDSETEVASASNLAPIVVRSEATPRSQASNRLASERQAVAAEERTPAVKPELAAAAQPEPRPVAVSNPLAARLPAPVVIAPPRPSDILMSRNTESNLIAAPTAGQRITSAKVVAAEAAPPADPSTRESDDQKTPAYVPARPLPDSRVASHAPAAKRAEAVSAKTSPEPSLPPIVSRSSVGIAPPAGGPPRLSAPLTPASRSAPLLPATAEMQPAEPAPIVMPQSLAQVPVVSPSAKMQAIRQQQRDTDAAAAVARSQPLVNPFVKPRPATTAAEKQQDHRVQPAAYTPETTLAELNGAPATEFAAAAHPAAQPLVEDVSGAHPVFAPAEMLPRPEDMLAPEFQLLKLPTSRLHPTAQPTWSAQDVPVRGPAEQPAVSQAHYFDWSGKVSQ